jgi:MGT family glycosyltransferase
MQIKVVLFNIPTSGHVNPTLPVAMELVRRGHEVVYYLTPGYRQRVEATGATFRAYEGVADDYFDEVSRRFNPAQLAAQLLGTARDLLPSLAATLRAEQPHAVVYDSMCPWGRLAAHDAGVTTVASMSLLDLPPTYILKSGQLAEAARLFARIFPWLLRLRRVARAIQESSGLTLPRFPAILNWPADHNIWYTSRQMVPGADRYGSNYTFVGPPVGPRPDAPEFPFEQLDGQRPLIYISLGTVFNENPEFFQRCLDAFGDGEHQVVMSTGRHVAPGSLGPLPRYVIVRPYVPQLELLQRASLFISHAGANSVHEGLYHGVPLLLAPQQMEQAMVAARVVELGAGLVLSAGATARQIRRQATRILHDSSFVRHAAELGDGLRTAGGAACAADALIGVAAGTRR